MVLSSTCCSCCRNKLHKFTVKLASYSLVNLFHFHVDAADMADVVLVVGAVDAAAVDAAAVDNVPT